MADNLEQMCNNFATTKAGFSAGTTSTLTTANACQYAINGKAYTKAATANVASPLVDARNKLAFTPVNAGFGTVFTLGFNAAGTLLAVQGDVKPLDPAGQFVDAPQFGTGPNNFCPAAYMMVRVDATGAPWIMGASALAGPPAGVTLSIVDVLVLPQRPQVI